MGASAEERAYRVHSHAWFNLTCNHAPPGIPPGICILSFLGGLFPTAGTQKLTIPYPRAPDRPHIRFFFNL